MASLWGAGSRASCGIVGGLPWHGIFWDQGLNPPFCTGKSDFYPLRRYGPGESPVTSASRSSVMEEGTLRTIVHLSFLDLSFQVYGIG